MQAKKNVQVEVEMVITGGESKIFDEAYSDRDSIQDRQIPVHA